MRARGVTLIPLHARAGARAPRAAGWRECWLSSRVRQTHDTARADPLVIYPDPFLGPVGSKPRHRRGLLQTHGDISDGVCECPRWQVSQVAWPPGAAPPRLTTDDFRIRRDALFVDVVPLRSHIPRDRHRNPRIASHRLDSLHDAFPECLLPQHHCTSVFLQRGGEHLGGVRVGRGAGANPPPPRRPGLRLSVAPRPPRLSFC